MSNNTERFKLINTGIFVLISAGGAAHHFRYDKVAAILLLISFIVALSMLPYAINNILNKKDRCNKTTDHKPYIQSIITSIIVIVAYLYYLMV